MRCEEVRGWLDDGRPPAAAAAAAAHASACAACAGQLEADEAIQRLLAEPLAPAPAGFTERLMARLPAPRTIPVASFGTETPWWLRAALDPAAVLALALAGVVSWVGGALWALGSRSGPWLADLLARGAEAGGLRAALGALQGPQVALGLDLALACLLLLATPALVRWGARAGKRAVAIRPRLAA